MVGVVTVVTVRLEAQAVEAVLAIQVLRAAQAQQGKVTTAEMTPQLAEEPLVVEERGLWVEIQEIALRVMAVLDYAQQLQEAEFFMLAVVAAVLNTIVQAVWAAQGVAVKVVLNLT